MTFHKVSGVPPCPSSKDSGRRVPHMQILHARLLFLLLPLVSFVAHSRCATAPCVLPVQVVATIPTGLPVVCEPRQACVELASCLDGSTTTTALALVQRATLDSGESWLSTALVLDLGASVHTIRAAYRDLTLPSLDADGVREIITAGSKLGVWDGTTLAPLGTASLTGRIYPQVAVADLDMDGTVEIVAGWGTVVAVYQWSRSSGLQPRTAFPVTVTTGEVRGLAVSDLDGDGRLEIVASCTARPFAVVLAADGKSFQPTGANTWRNTMASPAWPRYNAVPAAQGGDASRNSKPTPSSVSWGQNMALTDADGDGLLDVAITADTFFELFRLDGWAFDASPTLWDGDTGATLGQLSYRWENATFDQLYYTGRAAYPDTSVVNYLSFGTNPPALVDVDGDGSKDVVLAADVENDVDGRWRRQLVAYQGPSGPAPGTRIASFAPDPFGPSVCKTCTYAYATAAVAVADIDPDGTPELLVPGGDGFLYCLRLDGSLRWSVNVQLNLASVQVAEPVVADLTGDGSPEIIVASSVPAGSAQGPWFMVLNNLGAVLHSSQLPMPGTGNGVGSLGIAVADLKGDGALSILISTYVGTIIFDVSSAVKSVSQCVPWPVQRGGLLRRGERDYAVNSPNTCTVTTPSFVPDTVPAITSVRIDLRLAKGAVPAVVVRGPAASFNIVGRAAALGYAINFTRSGSALVATLIIAPPTTAPLATTPSPTTLPPDTTAPPVPITPPPTPPPTTPPPPTTTAPPLTALPETPVTGYVVVLGDVQLAPNDTLVIVVATDGSGGYLNVTGCVTVEGQLNVSVATAPGAGQSVPFLESPCITYNGSATVTIGARNNGCKRVAGSVGKSDGRHLAVLFAEEDKCTKSGLSAAAIAGICAGVVVLVGVAVVAYVLITRAVKRNRKKRGVLTF